MTNLHKYARLGWIWMKKPLTFEGLFIATKTYP